MWLICTFLGLVISSAITVDFNCASDPAEQYAVVNTASGPVRGKLAYTAIEYRPYWSFRGIPYAESPAFARRFLPPLPRRHWTQTKDCFEFGNICPQHDPRNLTNLVGHEDCLFLNVYTPHLKPTTAQTVMVYIHGGGFFFGSGNDDLQGPDLLLNRGDLIVVTINYRLGVLGFMSLGTPQYSGNQGLKDQQLALRWVQQNIAAFGGDPLRVTIFGQSAGSASSYFHTIAPQSRGLFQQAIQMSFTFSIWSVFERGDHLAEMYAFSVAQHYNAMHYADLVAFLRAVDARDIVSHFPIKPYDPQRVPITVYSQWLPVVENSAALQPFLQATPTQMLLLDQFDADVSVMAGYTCSESLFFTAPNVLHPETLSNFNGHFQIELPSMHFNRAYNSSAYRRVAAKIRERYFPRQVAINQNNATIQSFVQLISHVYQDYQIDRRLRLLASKSRGNVFMYRFGLVSQLNYYRNWLGASAYRGASHADDMCYIFHCGYIREAYFNVSSDATQMRHIAMMTGLYTNFAKYGNPVPATHRLKRATARKLHYLDITEDAGLVVGVNPQAEAMRFWEELVAGNPELMTHNVDRCVNLVIRALLNGE